MAMSQPNLSLSRPSLSRTAVQQRLFRQGNLASEWGQANRFRLSFALFFCPHSSVYPGAAIETDLDMRSGGLLFKMRSPRLAPEVHIRRRQGNLASEWGQANKFRLSFLTFFCPHSSVYPVAAIETDLDMRSIEQLEKCGAHG